jgi:hypothetical protein
MVVLVVIETTSYVLETQHFHYAIRPLEIKLSRGIYVNNKQRYLLLF